MDSDSLYPSFHPSFSVSFPCCLLVLSPRCLLASSPFFSSPLSSPPSFPPSVLAVQNKDGAAKLPALLTDLCGSP